MHFFEISFSEYFYNPDTSAGRSEILKATLNAVIFQKLSE